MRNSDLGIFNPLSRVGNFRWDFRWASSSWSVVRFPGLDSGCSGGGGGDFSCDDKGVG